MRNILRLGRPSLGCAARAGRGARVLPVCLVALSLLANGLLVSGAAHAADGTWISTTGGNWGDTTKWQGGVIAEGAGSTATFAADLSGGITVTNEANRTIGNISFDDTGTGPDSDWTLANSNNVALTLSNSGTSTITNASTGGGDVSISAVLAGGSTDNVVFNNSGTGGEQPTIRTITVTGANTYAGTTTLRNGFLNVGANSILRGQNGPLGNATSPIVLGDSGTAANATSGVTSVALLVTGASNTNVQDYIISRDISSSANVTGRTNIRYASTSTNTGAQGTLTVSGNWALSTASGRGGYGLAARRAGQTVNFTGAITGGNSSVPLRINDGGSTNGIGVVRLSNAANTYAGPTIVVTGTLLVGGNAPNNGPGVLGNNTGTTNAVQVNDGATGNGAGAGGRVLIDGAFTVGKAISLQGNGPAAATSVAYTLGGNTAAASAFSGNITSASNATSRTLGLTAELSGTVSFTGAIGANGDAAGVLNVEKVGAGTVTLGGANAYDGTTTVTAGTLAIGAANRIPDSSGLTLAGGTFSTGGFNEVLDVLSAPAASSISLGSGNNSTLRFGSFTGTPAQVSVRDYSGLDKLFIGTDDTGASETQEAQIKFVNPEELPSGTYNADQLRSGEIVPVIPNVALAGALISEFRFHGQGNPAVSNDGSADEFVEIANLTSGPLNVTGWRIEYDNGNGNTSGSGRVDLTPVGGATEVIIPARGHLLIKGTGYDAGELDGYAAGDYTMVGDALPNSGVRLLNANNVVVDKAGFSSSDASLREGAGLPGAPRTDGQYSFVRNNSALRLTNTTDNVDEFRFVATNAGTFDTITGAPGATGTGTLTAALGAPGPEGLASPLQPLSGLSVAVLDSSALATASPNRERYQAGDTSGRGAGGSKGTILLRRRITNNTGLPLTKLRFRVVNTTTRNNRSAGQADVRLRSSSASIGTESITVGGTSVSVFGTTLEEPPVQATLGGGLNSSAVVQGTLTLSPALPSAPGASGRDNTRNVSFLLGVEEVGPFGVTLSLEAIQ